MNLRSLLRLLAAIVWLVSAFPLAGAEAAPSRRPNILYIMADDHGAQAISAYGSVINKTPNLDRLAAQGMRFTNCFVTNSICMVPNEPRLMDMWEIKFWSISIGTIS